MPIRLNGNSFSAFNIGNTGINQIYLGQNLIWPEIEFEPIDSIPYFCQYDANDVASGRYDGFKNNDWWIGIAANSPKRPSTAEYNSVTLTSDNKTRIDNTSNTMYILSRPLTAKLNSHAKELILYYYMEQGYLQVEAFASTNPACPPPADYVSGSPISNTVANLNDDNFSCRIGYATSVYANRNTPGNYEIHVALGESKVFPVCKPIPDSGREYINICVHGTTTSTNENLYHFIITPTRVEIK